MSFNVQKGASESAGVRASALRLFGNSAVH